MAFPSQHRALGWLGGAALLAAALAACPLNPTIDTCGKACSADDDCGGADYACTNGVCGGSECGGTVGGGASGSSGGGASSGAASSGAGSSGASGQPSSAAVSSSSSGAASSAAASSSSTTGGTSSSMPQACTGMATGAPCGAGLICNASGACVSACFIGGTVVQPGNDPGNDCQACTPSVSTTAWTPRAATATCAGSTPCFDFRCDGAGACVGTDRCTGTTTPTCNTATGTCECATSPSDSCAGGTTNKVCVAGACGCNSAADCASGEGCDANNRCRTCTTPDFCGSTCGACRTLPMSLNEGAYYTCTSSTLALAQACSVQACSNITANCDSNDGDGTPAQACETDISANVANCGGCGLVCPAGRLCVNNQCRCGGADTCPAGQNCAQGRCKCTTSTECNAGYMCPTGDACTR